MTTSVYTYAPEQHHSKPLAAFNLPKIRSLARQEIATYDSMQMNP